MKRILILGASMLQIPAIKCAKSLGYHVGVIDIDETAPGIIYADEYFNVSTNNTQAILEIAQNFDTDGVMTMATDMPIRSVAQVCQKLNLPGIPFDTAVKATDKYKMVETFKENYVPHPWYYKISTEEELLSLTEKYIYPCIIKPVDSSGSRGVIMVNNQAELLKAYRYSKSHSDSGNILIQEYLEGNEVSVEVMVKDKEPLVLTVTDKITTGPPYFVEAGHSQPSRLSEDNLKKIKEVAIKAVNAIGITFGPAHVEIMLTSRGPVLIELGARLGGDFIASHLVYLSTGVDIVEAVIKESCGEKATLKSIYSKGSVIKYYSAPKGTIKEITGIENAKKITGVIEVSNMKKVGELVGDINSSNDRVGSVIVQGDNVALAHKICDEAIEHINIITK